MEATESFCNILNSATQDEYHYIAGVAYANKNEMLHIKASETLTQKFMAGEIMWWHVDLLLFQITENYVIKKKEVFSKIEPVFPFLFNELKNMPRDDMRIEGEIRYLWSLATANPAKYLTVIWTKISELVQKPKPDKTERGYIHLLLRGPFTSDDVNVVRLAMDLFQNRNFQQETANALYDRISYIKKRREYIRNQSEESSAERYILDKLVQEVIPFVHDHEEIIESLVRYVSSSHSTQHIQALKEKLPYLSELKRKIISAELK